MNNLIKKLALGIALLSLSVSAHAAFISMTPDNQFVNIGDSVSVDIRMHDLLPSESVGDFDFDIVFDATKLTLDSVDFGEDLHLGSFMDIQNWFQSGPNMLTMYEVSFESAQDLFDLQLDDFILATINFTTTDFGVATVDFDNVWALGDQYGDPMMFTAFSGLITIPEPGTIAVLLIGLLLLRRKLIT
ncbi:MAG: hypothetical protein JKY55_01805 [Aliivibrio sp.]|uniref:cohesin domain-containing protein n=1 Tax=Aliivibrio sp. TaxID=1872443 RepID=UPI001A3ADFC2|nr:hypothetical protein [Aliivibrio sp.]